MSAAPHGLLLFAHGARDPRWAAPFEAVAAAVRTARPAAAVRLAYLELMAPDIASAAAELAGAGCTRIEIVPLFLGAGGHVRNDVPALLQGLRERHPGVVFTLHAAVGEAPAVIAAMAAVALETLR
jgi:sirohydrochlorin cobaltochelatase